MFIARFRDPELGGARAGVGPAGAQAHIGGDGSGFGEAGRVFDRQHKALGGEGAYGRHLGEKGGIRVALLGRLLDLRIEGLDLQGELGDRPKSLCR